MRLDVKQLQYEMDKLNTSIASHGKKQDDLTNTNQNMETEFVRKLKEIEQNCLETENEVNRNTTRAKKNRCVLLNVSLLKYPLHVLSK